MMKASITTCNISQLLPTLIKTLTVIYEKYVREIRGEHGLLGEFSFRCYLDPETFAQAKTVPQGNRSSFCIRNHFSSILTEANEVSNRKDSLD